MRYSKAGSGFGGGAGFGQGGKWNRVCMVNVVKVRFLVIIDKHKPNKRNT